jgi:beta-1,2-mannobiose phosphorylase / 1,2-beta-oligomannan phosphorylase
MSDIFTRNPNNPIITPGEQLWRRATVFNPAAIVGKDGRIYVMERAAGELRPFCCSLGLLVSDDGVHFEHVLDRPVITPEDLGSKHGSVQDPRLTLTDGRYYLTYAFRPYSWSSYPTGVGVPESHETQFDDIPPPPEAGDIVSTNVISGRSDNLTRSGISVSDDLIHWEHLGLVTEPELDDRDVILFPEKINGRWAMLRRPLQWVGAAYGVTGASMWLSYSDDLLTWTDTKLVARAEFSWEDNRIGGATPPILLPEGWLVLYHGVQTIDKSVKRVVYRVGALLLDKNDPSKVLARTTEPILEPREYYEKFGLYIPNVVFPTGNFIKDEDLWVYYGVCDTAIALATAPIKQILAAMR